jgi:uncharacterized protein
MRFRWDPRKAAANERKHGVSFREAATVLRDPLSTTFPDHLHSAGEERFITIGRSATSALLVVVHTEGDQEIRIISARRATKAEQAYHEEGE